MSVLSELLKIDREYNIYKLTKEQAIEKAKAILATKKDSPIKIKLSRFNFGKH